MKESKPRRCCGLDVHQAMVMACVLSVEGDAPVIKSFGTFRKELIRLRVWLKQMKVTEVAMESTGVYWRPVWNILEEQGLRLLLANPQQVKALHGRKSDKRDCRRIAEFLHDKRLDGSFVPPREIRELRLLTRLRVSVLEERTEVQNQIRDLLETVNIKLTSVASDLMGVTGREILQAIVEGNDSPERLSWKARGKLRKKEEELAESLKGEFSPFFRETLGLLLRHYEFLSRHVKQIEVRIWEQVRPYEEQVKLLQTIPGVDEVIAWTLLAEMGLDMSVFPTSGHVSSWAGLSPGQNESAGVSKGSKTKKGNRYLRRALTQAGWAASHTKKGYLRAWFHRVKVRRGWGKAVVGLAHKILVIAYELLKSGEEYRDLGDDYFDKRNEARIVKMCASRLEHLGWEVTLRRVETPVVESETLEPPAVEKRRRGRPRKSPVVEPGSGLSPEA